MSRQFEVVHTIHEYERSKTNKQVYRCLHPKCTHYQRREYLVGKEAICFRCKQVFNLTWKSLRSKHPICEFCHDSPQARQKRVVRDAAFKVLNELPDELKQDIIETTLE